MKTMKNSRLLTCNIILEANTAPCGGGAVHSGFLEFYKGGFGCCGVHAAGFFITGMAWEEQGNDDGYLLTMESLSREKRRGSDCNVAVENINISD